MTRPLPSRPARRAPVPQPQLIPHHKLHLNIILHNQLTHCSVLDTLLTLAPGCTKTVVDGGKHIRPIRPAPGLPGKQTAVVPPIILQLEGMLSTL